MVLPYLGTQSLRLKKRLKLLKEQLPSENLEIILRCNLSYIGSSYKYWEKRLEGHLHMSALTGKPCKGLQSFALMLQAKEKRCISNRSNDFRIAGKEKDRHLVRLKKSIFINH